MTPPPHAFRVGAPIVTCDCEPVVVWLHGTNGEGAASVMQVAETDRAKLADMLTPELPDPTHSACAVSPATMAAFHDGVIDLRAIIAHPAAPRFFVSLPVEAASRHAHCSALAFPAQFDEAYLPLSGIAWSALIGDRETGTDARATALALLHDAPG